MVAKLRTWYLQLALALFGLGGSLAVQAAVPAYVTAALSSAQTTLTEYLEAAAPVLFAIVILVAATFLIVRFLKRAAS